MPLQWSCDGTVAGVPFTRQGSQVRTLYHPPVISNEIKVLQETGKTFFFSVGKIWEKNAHLKRSKVPTLLSQRVKKRHDNEKAFKSTISPAAGKCWRFIVGWLGRS